MNFEKVLKKNEYIKNIYLTAKFAHEEYEKLIALGDNATLMDYFNFDYRFRNFYEDQEESEFVRSYSYSYTTYMYKSLKETGTRKTLSNLKKMEKQLLTEGIDVNALINFDRTMFKNAESFIHEYNIKTEDLLSDNISRSVEKAVAAYIYNLKTVPVCELNNEQVLSPEELIEQAKSQVNMKKEEESKNICEAGKVENSCEYEEEK